jgi:hypothetical protein
MVVGSPRGAVIDQFGYFEADIRQTGDKAVSYPSVSSLFCEFLLTYHLPPGPEGMLRCALSAWRSSVLQFGGYWPCFTFARVPRQPF